jgi:hypothetical protein
MPHRRESESPAIFFVLNRIAALRSRFLGGSCRCLNDRIDELQVARIVRERNARRFRMLILNLAVGAEVVFYVPVQP